MINAMSLRHCLIAYSVQLHRKICNFTGNRDHINKLKKQGW